MSESGVRPAQAYCLDPDCGCKLRPIGAFSIAGRHRLFAFVCEPCRTLHVLHGDVMKTVSLDELIS